ncbi:hypothetical protein IV203_004223 [Nitzschia inconspicua]|uniref:Uncharacterized protein n=1 Tax=Nitzschia inconspicua TaxID=303405 RepID=A0A9K3PPH4_9STRA|nr:hypothetical protein IV203_004223 [Nitzschia inconspicua]
MSSFSGKKRNRKETRQDHKGSTSGSKKSPHHQNVLQQDVCHQKNESLVGQTISFDREGRQHEKRQRVDSKSNHNQPSLGTQSSASITASSNQTESEYNPTFVERIPLHLVTHDRMERSNDPPLNEQRNSQTLQRLIEQLSSVEPAPTTNEANPIGAIQKELISQLQQNSKASQPQDSSQSPSPSRPSNDLNTGSDQTQLALSLLQQQQQQQQQPMPCSINNNEVSAVVLQSVLSILPHLSSFPANLHQQLLSLLQQHLLDQQRSQQQLLLQQQQQQQQLAMLLGALLPQQHQQQEQQQQQRHQNNVLAQIGALQHLLTLASHGAIAIPQNALVSTMVHLLAVVSNLGPGFTASNPLLPATLPLPVTSDSTALLQLLLSYNPNMAQITANTFTSDAPEENPATVAQAVTEISGSSDLSTDQSHVLHRPLNTSNVRSKREADDGRPSDAFLHREPDGRARDLPTLLVMPSDLAELSSHQTLLRYQIEVFRAGEEDVATHTRGRNKKVELGQIGIRCRHCKVLPVSDRLRGSVYFPRTLEGFYQASQNMNSTHLQTGECQMMGPELRQEFADLVSSRGANSTGAGRAYWIQQARILGLENDEDGIRFCSSDPPSADTSMNHNEPQRDSQS